MKQLHIISWSGGKDSTAMVVRMLEIGMQVDVLLFADTKEEFKAMYIHQRVFRRWIKANYPHVKIVTVRTLAEFKGWMTGKVTRGRLEGKERGWPLKLHPCYWTREAKFKMLDPICKGHQRYIGYAANEPKRIAAAEKQEGYNTPLNDWGWDEDKCLRYLEERGLSCQLYRDFNRTGCYFCPKQPIKNLEIIYRKYPEEWAKMMVLEELSRTDWGPDVNLKQIQDRIEDQLLFNFKWSA